MRGRYRLALTGGNAPSPARSARDLSPHSGERKIESRSRGAFSAPEFSQPTVVNRHHRCSRAQNAVLRTPMSVLHAKRQQANAGGSMRKRSFGTDDAKKEPVRKKKKDSEAERRQTQLVFCRADGRSRAWSTRRTSIGVPPRFSPLVSRFRSSSAFAAHWLRTSESIRTLANL
jgi:hypothetical protein